MIFFWKILYLTKYRNTNFTWLSCLCYNSINLICVGLIFFPRQRPSPSLGYRFSDIWLDSYWILYFEFRISNEPSGLSYLTLFNSSWSIRGHRTQVSFISAQSARRASGFCADVYINIVWHIKLHNVHVYNIIGLIKHQRVFFNGSTIIFNV